MSRFDYVRYDIAANAEQARAKEIVQNLEKFLDDLFVANSKILPGGPSSAQFHRYRALAMTTLEECYSWIGKTIRELQIARNGSAPIEEGRTESDPKRELFRRIQDVVDRTFKHAPTSLDPNALASCISFQIDTERLARILHEQDSVEKQSPPRE